MTAIEEKDALNEIINLLPPGYIKTVPASATHDVSFEYNGITMQMSKLYVNSFMNCYCFDLSWSSVNSICGIPVNAGVDILKQFSTPLPNLYAYNIAYPGEEIKNYMYLSLMIIDESILENG